MSPADMSETMWHDGDARIHCALFGAGPLVICAHGFPDSEETFSLLAPALVAAGYRVALPTMRGYAPSGTAASGRYDAAALGADLLALADRLSPNDPVRLVGHDWGAIAGYAAAAIAPARIAQLVTMAVPHLRVASRHFLRPAQLRRSWYIGAFQLPGAERRLLDGDLALVERLWRDWSPGYRCSADRMARIKAAIRPHPEAVLGYYRALTRSLRGRRVLFARTRPPALYLHGRDDGCLGAELCRGLERAYEGGLEQHLLVGAGHFLHLEQPERVAELLLRFFSRSPR